MKPFKLMAATVFAAAFMAACGPDNGEEAPDGAPDYDSEARESISEENMDAVLDQLEEEIAADEAAIEVDD